MSDTGVAVPPRGWRSWAGPMRARSVDEAHRASTPLELFFDLCFVVAVAQAAELLHHSWAEGHVLDGLGSYATVFFAIWWAWMNFTWFASAYDCNDVAYRLTTFLQITGVLILAAGIPRAYDHDFSVVTYGYAVMRVGLVTQWLRAAHGDPENRQTCLRFAAGISLCMVGWFTLLLLPERAAYLGFFVMVVAEICVPLYAERAGRTSWHPGHIAERYQLFTLIVLGESVLSASLAVQRALDLGSVSEDLASVLVGAPLVVFSMWWLYFAKPAHVFLHGDRQAFVWGYGHYFVFSSAAAVGAGLALAVDVAAGVHVEGSAAVLGLAVTAPAAAYVFVVWLLHLRPHGGGRAMTALFTVGPLVIVAAAWTVEPVLVAGVLMVLLVMTGARLAHPKSVPASASGHGTITS